MEFPIDITLQRPVTVDGKTYNKLSFDEPDLGTSLDVEEAKRPQDQTLILLAGMAEVSVAVIRKLKERDFMAVRDRVLDPYQKETHERMQAAAGNEIATA